MRSIKRISSLVIGLLAWGVFMNSTQAQVICPKVIMVQVDGCATPQERESEYFQFITGTSSFILNSNTLSIGSNGTRNGWKAVPSTVAALNMRLGTCADGLPIFADPFAAPYNGVIPPLSVVMAFIDQAPSPTTSSLNSLCGSGLIFVIGGNATNPLAMFANRAECISDCLKPITVVLGSCNFTFNYNPFLLDDVNGSYITINEDGSIEYQPSNACRPLATPCDLLVKTVPNQVTECKFFGYTLENFSDPPSPNASYFTLPSRAGKEYPIGTVILDSITLYANAWNICKPQNVLEFPLKINIITGPDINDALGRTEQACGYYILPAITGVNLSGTQKYWTQQDGKGVDFMPGDTIKSNITLFAYDKQGSTGCIDEEELTIQFVNAPNITNPKDTTVPCGSSLRLSAFNGTNLTGNIAYYQTSKKNSPPIPHSTFVTTGGIYYAYDEVGHCFDEDTFTISLITNIAIPRDTIRNDTFCTEYTLPGLKTLTLSYNTRLDGLGISYLPADKIISSTKLYVKASKTGCEIKDSVEYTRQWVFINPIIIDQPCQPVLDTLPVIKGNFLSNQVAYYSEMGGKGKRYLPGDSVHAFKRNFFYDSKVLYAYDSVQYRSGKCVSEVPVIIPFFTIVEIVNIPDTNLACGKSFSIPVVKPENFFNGAIYTQPNKQGIKLTPGTPISSNGTYYSYGDLLRCHDEDTFRINFAAGPIYQNNPDLSACNAATLLQVQGNSFRPDSTFYFSQSFGQGIRYTQGTSIPQSTTLYIFDLSQPQCLKQDTLLIQVTPQPDLQLPGELNNCDSLPLPTDPIVTDLRYYTQSGRLGQSFLPGVMLKNNQTLFAYTGDPGCFDEDTLTVQITPSPQIEGLRDTTLCNELLLPVIKGNNLTGDQHYHILPGDVGQDFYGGVHYASQTSTYYAWNGNGNCFDEDTLLITIIPKPVIDSITPINACEQYVLPKPQGVNLTSVSYFDAPDGKGKEYPIGNVISQTTRLYAFQNAVSCPAQRPVFIAVRDSTTSQFSLSSNELCKGETLNLRHQGKRSSQARFDWQATGSHSVAFTNLPDQSLALDTGTYHITLHANSGVCDGQSVTQSIKVINPLGPLTHLVCMPDSDRIVFSWDQVPDAVDYKIELITGPTGVRSPYQMIFSNLFLGQQVGVQITPLSSVPCANGQAAALTCATRICDNVRINVLSEPSFCSGDGPTEPRVITNGITDTAGYQRVWTGPGIIDGVFYPSVAGPGNHTIQYTLTKDSCRFVGTVIYSVGSGSVLILNDKAVECAPPSQQQFNIRMRIQTDNKPYRVFYSYSGNSSSVFQSSADNFTLSASFGLIGDSIRIDSILDVNGCKMQITSNAGTQTFRAVRYISSLDTSSICDFATRTYQYRIVIRNSNNNDPLRILAGNGIFQDSIYISPPIPFGQRHQASISHANACDTLSWDILIPCSCDAYLDTFTTTACQNQIITIRGKTYTINQPSGLDTIPSATPGFCDTIRLINIRFLFDRQFIFRPTLCLGDMVSVGNMVFDQTHPTGVVRLSGRASNGCDSVITVQLDFFSPVINTIRDTICMGDSVRLSGLVFHQNHTRDSIRYLNQSGNGCDSLVYFIIQVENVRVDLSIESSGCSITSSKSIVIRSITGGALPYVYSAGTANFNPIVSLPLRLSQFNSDTFNLVIRSSQGCSSTTPVRFAPINGNLHLSLGPDRVVPIGAQVQLDIQTNFNLRSVKWITQNYLSCLNCNNPIASPLTSTLYIVEGFDPNGCIARDTLWILIDPAVAIYVPNILKSLSINDQNRELQIYPSAQVQSVVRFTLFDRWGTTLVDLANLGSGGQAIPVWDGLFKGIDAPNGVYIYKMVYTTLDNKSRVKYGDITVFR